MSETRDGGGHQDEKASGAQNTQPSTQETAPEQASGWFATAAARTGLVLIGLVLLLFALGQAVGADLLGMFVEAISSRMGRWLVVAFFAVVLIAVAARWGRNR